MRIVIECKRDAIAEIVLNNLYKQTQLQDTFGIIMLALVNNIPKVMDLKEVLTHFLNFRREIIINRTKFELGEAEARSHILEGLKIALENIDSVIAIIRSSSNPTTAKESLIAEYKFSNKQTKAILDMRLQKLTSLEIDKVVQEYKQVKEQFYDASSASPTTQSTTKKPCLRSTEIRNLFLIPGRIWPIARGQAIGPPIYSSPLERQDAFLLAALH